MLFHEEGNFKNEQSKSCVICSSDLDLFLFPTAVIDNSFNKFLQEEQEND